MWTIISVAIPVVLAMYGLSRLQQNRNSHGAQGPAESAYNRRTNMSVPAQLYHHENSNLPSTDFPATTLQSAEEKEEAARKYLVKWDSDEELEPGSNVALHIDSVSTSQDVEEKKSSGKHKQADVKWDAFEEK